MFESGCNVPLDVKDGVCSLYWSAVYFSVVCKPAINFACGVFIGARVIFLWYVSILGLPVRRLYWNAERGVFSRAAFVMEHGLFFCGM